MCGIPMTPPPDAVTGKRLTLEQAMAHIGGLDQFFTPDGRMMIKRHVKDYIWKYPEHGYCTACGGDVGDLKAKHGTRMDCPLCGKEVEFRHEARGHRRVFDQFCLYEWRKSAVDPQTIVLTAAHVWRDSTLDRPERSPRLEKPTAIYIFTPGRAVTVYKNHCWGDGESREARYWNRIDSVGADHTAYMGGKMDIVQSYGQFRDALRGTRIGETFDLLNTSTNRRDTLELEAIANCARRPWLEYLYKAGQPALAGQLMRWANIPKEIIPNQRAKSVRMLLGLTEGQWYQIRTGHIDIRTDELRIIHALRRCGLEGAKMSEACEIARRTGRNAYGLSLIAPSPARKPRYAQDTIGDMLNRAPISDKLRRKAYRRILGDVEHAIEWRDYFAQLVALNEDMSNTALLLPKNMHEMHQRMIERERVVKLESRIKALEGKREQFEAALEKLRQRYTFEACGLVLRPYESAREVVEEGAKLSICIGSYAESYLEGRTVLCCLRRADAPDVPWRAVEFSTATGAMVQDRGYKNDINVTIPTEDRARIDGFWRAWNERKKGRNTA